MATNMTPFASTTLLPTVTVSNSGIIVYIVVGGVLFLLILIVVLGVIVGLSVRRAKQLHSTQPDGWLKSSKQKASDTSLFNLPRITNSGSHAIRRDVQTYRSRIG